MHGFPIYASRIIMEISYRMTMETKVVKAAPFKPLSSLSTCINITWLGLITSWILYLLIGYLFSFLFSSILFSNGVFSIGSLLDIFSTLNKDIYSIFSSVSNDNNTAFIKIMVNPLVKWVWIGGYLLVFGTVIALWPRKD